MSFSFLVAGYCGLSQVPIFRPVKLIVRFMPPADAVMAPVYESVPLNVISPVPCIGICPLHWTVQVALLPTVAKFEVTQLGSPPGGGWVQVVLAQIFVVCGGGETGMPGMTTWEVVSH
jgi:hypothetical protein